jgi:hypothetical protein
MSEYGKLWQIGSNLRLADEMLGMILLSDILNGKMNVSVSEMSDLFDLVRESKDILYGFMDKYEE